MIQTQPGKLEAYFFPPVNVPPYKDVVCYITHTYLPYKRYLPTQVGELNVISRLGLKPEVTKEDVVTALKQFGKDDSFYTLMAPYHK